MSASRVNGQLRVFFDGYFNGIIIDGFGSGKHVRPMHIGPFKAHRVSRDLFITLFRGYMYVDIAGSPVELGAYG